MNMHRLCIADASSSHFSCRCKIVKRAGRVFRDSCCLDVVHHLFRYISTGTAAKSGAVADDQVRRKLLILF